MKTAIVWIITFVLFVFVRIILVEIGIIDSRQRVGGIIDGVILLGLIAFVQSCARYLSKHRKDKVNSKKQRVDPEKKIVTESVKKERPSMVKTGELNSFFCLIVVLGIFGNVISIIIYAIKSLTPETIEYEGQIISYSSHLASIVAIVASIFTIVSLVLSLTTHKIGIYGFAATVFFFNIISLAFYEDRASQIPTVIGTMVGQYVLFFGALMFKHNGVRSWNVFFPPKTTVEYDNTTSSDRQELNGPENTEESLSVSNEKVVGSSVEPITMPKHEKVLQDPEKLSTSSEINEEPQASPKKHSKPYKKVVLVFLLVCLIIAVLVSGGLWYHKTSQPEYQYAKADTLFKHGKTKEALEDYTKLADEQNYVKAKTRLGVLYVDNDTVKPNYKLGIKYLTEVAYVDTTALEQLYDIYIPTSEINNSKFTNLDKLGKLAKKAIDKDFYLGRSYYILGAIAAENKDYELAFYNWDKSASYHYSLAYTQIGWLYLNGYGCEEDDTKAMKYFRKAISIDKKEDYAMALIGYLYKYGYGVDIDLGKAYKYLSKSAELGNDDAKKEVADLKMHHSAVELLDQ